MILVFKAAGPFAVPERRRLSALYTWFGRRAGIAFAFSVVPIRGWVQQPWACDHRIVDLMGTIDAQSLVPAAIKGALPASPSWLRPDCVRTKFLSSIPPR